MGKCRLKKDKQTFVEQSQGLPQFLKQKAKDSKPEDFHPVEIFKPDGSLQCGMGQSIPLSNMAQKLKAKGISILKSQRSHDGMMHTQVCGGPTGFVNIFEIYKRDLPQALKLGFKKR